jgi:hypothetical protein
LQALARPGSDDRIAAYLRRVIADYLIHRQRPDDRPTASEADIVRSRG